MPKIKLSFVIDEGHVGPALRAMKPFRGMVSIDDMEEATPEFEQQIIGQEPAGPPPRKPRTGIRRTRIKISKSTRAKANGTASNKYGYVQNAVVKILKQHGAMEPKELHDEMVRQGFKLQSSYNAVFVAKKSKLIRLDEGKLVLGEAEA